MKNLPFLMIAMLLSAGTLLAQVAINTDGADPNDAAMLDVSADDKGMLAPRIALVSTTDPISNTKPVGLLVYNTSTSGNYPTPGFYYWNGTDWEMIGQPAGKQGKIIRQAINCL